MVCNPQKAGIVFDLDIFQLKIGGIIKYPVANVIIACNRRNNINRSNLIDTIIKLYLSLSPLRIVIFI